MDNPTPNITIFTILIILLDLLILYILLPKHNPKQFRPSRLGERK